MSVVAAVSGLQESSGLEAATNISRRGGPQRQPPVLPPATSPLLCCPSAWLCGLLVVLKKSFAAPVMQGYNATVLAYGQTGSGKTLTMSGGSGIYGNKERGTVSADCNRTQQRRAGSSTLRCQPVLTQDLYALGKFNSSAILAGSACFDLIMSDQSGSTAAQPSSGYGSVQL